jgi:hypothetical protein
MARTWGRGVWAITIIIRRNTYAALTAVLEAFPFCSFGALDRSKREAIFEAIPIALE